MTLNDRRQPPKRNYQRLVVYLEKHDKTTIQDEAQNLNISTSKHLADIIKTYLHNK